MLFAPANHARRAEKALVSTADVVVLDLEDSVPASEKAAARTAVGRILSNPSHPRLYVRLNHPSGKWFADDLAALAGPWFEGVVLPKIEHPDELRDVESSLQRIEHSLGIPLGKLKLLPIIETAIGVAQVDAIAAASSRSLTLIFGAADYSLDLGLGLEWGRDELELLYARSRIAHACRLGDLDPPIDAAILQVRNIEDFKSSARNGRRFGFQGKLCLHPDQIGPCHEIFTPDPAQVKNAQQVLAAYTEAVSRGEAAIEVDGMFVDEPVAERARRLIRRAT